MNMEIWKDVVGFEGIYKVSNLGEVKALERDVDYGNRICHRKERLLSKHFNSDKYYTVKLLDNKNHPVHRLVAEAFLGKHEGLEVDHIDGCRTNNNINNLRFITHYENLLHTYELGHGHMSNRRYGDNYNAKKVHIYNDNEDLYFNSILECSEWIQKNVLKDINIKSIYYSICRCNKIKKPYCGYNIEY